MYYKINKQQADLIGEFTYRGINFSPYGRAQRNGFFLVSENMYNKLKGSAAFKKINWDSIPQTSDFDDLIPDGFIVND